MFLTKDEVGVVIQRIELPTGGLNAITFVGLSIDTEGELSKTFAASPLPAVAYLKACSWYEQVKKL